MAKTITHTGVITSAQGGFKAGAFTSPIYLGDIGRRNGLGGGTSVYGLGQDQYLDVGGSVTLQETSDVLLSIAKGTLAKLAAMGLVTIA